MYRTPFAALALATVTSLCAPVLAGDLSNFSSLSQTEFMALSKDLAAATSVKAMEPAATLGMVGFDISASGTVTKTQAGSAWVKTTGSGLNNLDQTKLSVSKGLSGGVDLGGFVSKAMSSNVTATGVQLKYALLQGSVISPAVALRASHSRMGGVSSMSLSNTAVDVLISKGFLGLTPYVGFGTVYSSAKANGVVGLSDASFNQRKSFVGVSFNALLLNLTAEYDRTGDVSSLGLKAGVRF